MIEHAYWQRQKLDEPLYPKMIWSRPENKSQAGKLLIIGGNQWGFAAPADAYNDAQRAGIGIARVLLPEAVHKIVGNIINHAESAPNTPSGSFSKLALDTFVQQSEWSDIVMLAGDFGKNSETEILLENYLTMLTIPIIITGDAIEYLKTMSEVIKKQHQITLVVNLEQLRKLATTLHYNKPFTSSMDFLHLIDTLHDFSERYKVGIIVEHLDTIFVAADRQVSSTHLEKDTTKWQLKTASYAAVWYGQNKTKPFESLTSAVFMVATS